MPGGEEQRRLEHGVCRRHAGECAGDLRRDVEWHFTPRDAALRSVGESHGGIEVRARDGAERQDQGQERRARRQGVREKSDGDVASRQPFGHDPGAHDSCQQHGSPDTLGGQALRQPERLLFCDGHADLPFSVYTPAGSPVETIWEVPREQVLAVRGPVARGSTNSKKGRGWGPLPAPSPGARLLPYSSAYHGVVEIGARQSGNVWRIRFGSFARCSPRRCSISSVGL